MFFLFVPLLLPGPWADLQVHGSTKQKQPQNRHIKRTIRRQRWNVHRQYGIQRNPNISYPTKSVYTFPSL